jgi:F-type H+-transporting ATPase subunit epsilon
MPIRCDIVTQERSVFSGDVNMVVLPGAEGVMGVLPHHSPMLTSLNFGEVIVRHDGGEEFFAVGGGIAEIQPDHIIILADSAEAAEEIDVDRAQRARDEAQRIMSEGVPKDPERYAQIEAQLRRAQVRIDVGRRRGGRRRATMAGFQASKEGTE